MRLVNLDLLTYFWGKLKTYFVKQESGKSLTSNDYTTEEKINWQVYKIMPR